MKRVIFQLPSPFIEKIKRIYPSSYPRILESFCQKKLHTFRVNYLKINLSKLRKELQKEKIRYRELSWPKGSFILYSNLRELQRSYIYQEGLIYVQNISSMIPPILLSPQKGEKILDMCAAPGAKTTQIASLVADNAQIVAVEKIRTRFYKLLANLKIQGTNCVKPLLIDGIRIRNKFSDYFDKILLDAPCSCEGLFYISNPHSFKYWKERKVKEMAHKQKKLLSSAIYALKKGGILVYSTCTFSPEENEEVIDWALKKFEGNIRVVPISIPLKNVKGGLERWRDKYFSPQLELCLRIIPNRFMEGFFIAKLMKE
ncbi:MAG: RsmB/NOP family class I SAM-dependent RNA methyltransferase [Candidatus Omnitrophica bacterium]|nr:RsmB/NOP family class I SAM-dependent RNA methyltransferase [Candidatus Omnitrophota bacterium]